MIVILALVWLRKPRFMVAWSSTMSATSVVWSSLPTKPCFPDLTPWVLSFFSTASEDSFIYGRMSERMTEAQKAWAKNFLVSSWNNPMIRCRSRLRISDDLVLALSWFTGVDIFNWRFNNVAQLFFHICHFGGLKDECQVASQPPRKWTVARKLIWFLNFFSSIICISFKNLFYFFSFSLLLYSPTYLLARAVLPVVEFLWVFFTCTSTRARMILREGSS